MVVDRYGAYKTLCAIQHYDSHLLREVLEREREFPKAAE